MRSRRRTGSTRSPNAAATARNLRVVGSIEKVLVAPQDPGKLLDALADPRIRIVTLTITEKAYLRNAAGDLDAAHPDIVADLANPAAPHTAHGFIAEALARRRAAGAQPFTILSCDNLPSNGATLHRLLVQFAALRDPELAGHVEGVSCPSSMVDRIVPATTDADRARVSGDAWRRGRMACHDRAVPAMGRSRTIFRRDGRTGRSSASRWCATSGPSRR